MITLLCIFLRTRLALSIQGATHVVTGIKWGGTMIASFEYEKTNEKDKKDMSQVKGVPKANLEKLSSYLKVLVKFIILRKNELTL
ncbi:hypothetical protein C2G38_2061144 [Gigaspora rosea]|uniref:Uncharacterized protein n=1 Tax=Gigaspora rosea TaxID=44941 RepID=A0A397W2C4_9GLOM|nr:hypothetical protein C2G38_2061144 [Gigaspora rosea]